MHPTRYISHPNQPPTDLSSAADTIHDALISNLQRLRRHPSSRPGVYLGSAGALLTDWHVAFVLPSLVLPKAYSPQNFTPGPFSPPRTGAQASFLETSVGPATLLLIQQLHEPRDTRAWKDCIQLLDGALRVALREEVNDDGCEVLYGRAGLLYALLLLRSELTGSEESSTVRDIVAQLTSDAHVRTLVDDIVQRGRFGAQEFQKELEKDERAHAPPLMWSWHGKRYLGGAHGVSGILQMLVSSPTVALAPHWVAVLGTVEWLLAIQEPLGNWPSKAGRHMARTAGGSATSRAAKRVSVEDDACDSLVQWCHGAPGVLILLASLLRRGGPVLPVSAKLREAAIAALKRGGELVYTRGLLRKGVGLCHGVAGSVYALLAVADVLDPDNDRDQAQHDAYWLERAVDLALRATAYRGYEQKGEMLIPDRPYSLYEGVGGMCCAWAEVLARLRVREEGRAGGWRRGMPGYDDLRFEC
ncbi:hypothetical protein BKA93DRAFT_63498 [Sparassis latifolia]